jgi:arginine N-succinyltransferase
MKIIRPIQASDYNALHQIAVDSGHGFTSLPVNEALLRKRIDISERSFQKEIEQPGDESYLFVMEDTETGDVVGTSGVVAAVGLDEAFYHYYLSKVVHSSRELGIYNTVDILTLCNDYTGASEICTLFLQEPARQGLNGRLLSKFRFLFMAEHAHRFSETVIAEMRGVSDDQGKSPFWQWLGSHFFSLDFPTADYLTGIGQKVFIAELMPKYPIYVSLLSEAAQKVIGVVHEKTKPALRLLENEGFKCTGYVDIFDAGPTVEADLHHIEMVKRSDKRAVRIVDQLADSAEQYIAINTETTAFRGAIVAIELVDGYAQITHSDAQVLGVIDNNSIRFAPIL